MIIFLRKIIYKSIASINRINIFIRNNICKVSIAMIICNFYINWSIWGKIIIWIDLRNDCYGNTVYSILKTHLEYIRIKSWCTWRFLVYFCLEIPSAFNCVQAFEHTSVWEKFLGSSRVWDWNYDKVIQLGFCKPIEI